MVEDNAGLRGGSSPRRAKIVDIKAQDPFGFTPFLKTSPDGREVWLSHKLGGNQNNTPTTDEFLDSVWDFRLEVEEPQNPAA